MIDVMIVVASSGKNLELAGKIKNCIEKSGKVAEVLELDSLEWPLFTQGYYEAEGAPEGVLSVVEKVSNAKRFVFVAPQYNGGIPPVLTNFFAWVSISTKEWRDAFNGKIAAIATHSGSGGLHLLMALRVQLGYVGMTVVGRELHTNYGKALNEESLDEVVRGLLA
jgi:chromate reductase, NAD(P)H dehydrogenase (quinone)